MNLHEGAARVLGGGVYNVGTCALLALQTATCPADG